VSGIHMFDMNTWNGTDLFQTGADGNDGIVYRSMDGGATWSQSLRVPTVSDFARVYGLGRYQGKLYADVEQISSTPVCSSEDMPRTRWSSTAPRGPTVRFSMAS